MNTFMNFVKKFLVRGGTRGKMGALEGIGDLLLLASDLAPANLSCSLEMLAGGLTKGSAGWCKILELFAKNGDLNVIFLNRLADPLGVELLKL